MRNATSLIVAAIALAACGSTAVTSSTTTTPTAPTSGTDAGTGVNTSGMYGQFGKAVTVTLDSSALTAVLRTTDVPDHPTPYWGAGNPLYEPPQAGMMPNGFTL